MKKNVHFAALFPYNLALITDNAPSSVNPSINLINIRWHQTQLLPWDYAFAHVTPGLHTDFSDLSISMRKWKRFLFRMLMLISLPFYTG